MTLPICLWSGPRNVSTLVAQGLATVARGRSKIVALIVDAEDALIDRINAEVKPDFFQHQTEDWLVFPYEISGLTTEEIREHKPYLLPLLEKKPPADGANP